MVTLADFNKPADADTTNPLATFAGGGTLDTGKPVNQDTITNIAAHAAILSPPDQVTNTYSSVNNELTNTGTSPTLDNLVGTRKTLDDAANLNAVKGAMSDPNVSVDTRVQLMNGYMNMQNSPVEKSLSSQVTTQAAMSPSSPSDNDETEYTRIDTTKDMDEVDAYNGWVSAQANNIRNSRFQDGLDKTVDVVEGLVPFMSQGSQAQIQSALADPDPISRGSAIVKALALSGESKESLAEAVSKMPIEDRMVYAQKLLDIVKNSNGSITTRPNTLNMINDLQDALTSGNYSSTSRITDNIASLLDLTIFAGPVWKGAAEGAKSLLGITKGVSSAADAARADAALSRLGRTTDEAVATAKATTEAPVSQATTVADSVPNAFQTPSEALPRVPEAVDTTTPKSVPALHPQVKNEGDFQNAYSKVTDVGNLPAGGEVGNQSAFENAYSTAYPIITDTSDATRQIITDNIHEELSKLGASDSVIQDAKAAVGKMITPTSLSDPTLPQQITDTMRSVFKAGGASPIDRNALKRVRGFVDAQANVERRVVRTDVDFGSVSQKIKDVNPQKARDIFDAVVNDQSGDLAKTLYGTTREEAIANDVLPEIAEEGGTVRGKYALDDDSGPNPDQAFINDQKKVRGDIHFSDYEKDQMRNTVKGDFDNVVGLTPRREMGTIGDTVTGVKFDQVFGPKDGGFVSAPQGIRQVKFALKKYGVRDNELEILKRDAQGNFSPVSMSNDPGEYLIRVNHEYEFSPADTQSWSLLGPNKFWKMFDALPTKFDLKMGGIMEHLIPPVNINDSLLTNAASNASDQAARIYKGLEHLGQDYAGKFNKLDTFNKNLVSKYIIKANDEGIAFDANALKGVGFSDDAVDAVRAWKHVQDTNWHFENADLNKTLHSLGWERYVDQTGNSDLIVRRVGQNSIERGELVLDGTGRLIKPTDKDLDKLYKEGGTLAQLRRPIEQDGNVIDHILVKNNSESSYLRRIREDDDTLTYRDGYYAVKYKNPYFITKNIVGANGKSVSKAVATAGSRNEAEDLITRLKTTDTKGDYNLRDDVKKNPTDLDNFKWDEIVNSGRSPQRIRGERLNGGNNVVTDLNHVSMETPEESLISSIRSLSNRMAMRDYLQAAKQRWMSQFAHTLKGQDVQGFPDSITTIGGRTKLAKLGDVASAKVSWRYINAMENGYVNLLDDFSKSFFNEMSDVAGRSKSMAIFEKPLRGLGEVGPASGARKIAFRLTLAANPLRQFPVQALQALPTMLLTNPLAIPKVAAQLVLLHGFRRGLNPADMGMFLGKFTGLDGSAASSMFEHWKMAGFENAVNANSLIRDDLTRLTDSTIGQKVGRVIGTPLDIAQKFGFQAGENTLMDTMWLSEYDLLKKSGRPINGETLQLMNARVRHMTTDMNKAGDMPYNANALSFVMQFAQASHKAFALMVFGHKGLTMADRIRITSGSLLLYGIGADAVNYGTSLVDNIVPNNWPGKEALKNGIFDLMLNTTLSNLFHQDVNVDVSDSLRQMQFPNLFQFFQGVQQWNPQKMVSSTPSGALFGRMADVVQEMARPFTSSSDRTPEEAETIARAFLSLNSGVSNYFKARYIMEHQKIMTNTGTTVDFHASPIEGLMRLAGFSTMAELEQYAFQENDYRMSQEPMNDVRQFIANSSKHLARQDISASDTKYFLDMLGEAQLHYKNDPFYMHLFQQQLAYKASQGDDTVFNSVMKLIGFHNKHDIQLLIDNSPLDDGQKASIMKAAEAAEGNYTNGSN